jgi:HSP20 family protein
MKTLVKRDGRQNLMPSVFDNFFSPDIFNWDINYANSGYSIPSVNIKETSDNFIVEMAAPGLEKKDFKIELDGTALTISSEKENQSEKKEGENYSRKEFSYQSFYRTFHLPKDVVNSDKIKAKYENGLLTLEIPKREEAKQKPPKFINVQ